VRCFANTKHPLCTCVCIHVYLSSTIYWPCGLQGYRARVQTKVILFLRPVALVLASQDTFSDWPVRSLTHHRWITKYTLCLFPILSLSWLYSNRDVTFSLLRTAKLWHWHSPLWLRCHCPGYVVLYPRDRWKPQMTEIPSDIWQFHFVLDVGIILLRKKYQNLLVGTSNLHRIIFYRSITMWNI
jgi:hypothetical protein